MNKILMLSAYDDNFKYIGDLTYNNKIIYAKENGYDFFCKRRDFINLPISWDKIYTIIEIFQRYDYEYIFWTDADAFIHNPSIRIENILNMPRLNECVLIHSGNNLNCKYIEAKQRSKKILRNGNSNNAFFWVSSCNITGPC